MIIVDGVLKMKIDVSLEELSELKEILSMQLDRIEEISFMGETEDFSTSSLFSLLFALKKTKPEIKIPLIDKGFTEFQSYGKVYWNNKEV